jgi:hypothetical protein
MNNLLVNDKTDDLFYEGGRVRGDFLKRLGSGHISAALLSHMLAASPSSSTTAWKEILRAAFSTFKAFSFTADLAELHGQLAALAALTSEPVALRLVASMLLEEVVAMNADAAAHGLRSLGRDWEGKSLLGPLLSISGWLDPKRALAAARGSPIDGLLPRALKDVRGYPANRCACNTPLVVPQP